MRLAAFAALALIAAPALADSPSAKPEKPVERPAVPGQEQGIYRFGATYSVLRTGSASACQSSCAADGQCFAWSFVEVSGEAAARCELKRGGGRVERNMLATSGISARHENKYATRIVLPSGDLDGGPDSAPLPPLGAQPVVSYDPAPVVTRTYTRTVVRSGATPRYPATKPGTSSGN
ncbi:MAG: PAN domain-containing protein [Hyphomonas sp.]|uniref:PAN domain-containing protein n=1 Tax=Hyphomonas sp. TaxID=87 RepID=UPI0035275643